MIFIAVSMILDQHPWYQLLGLSTPTLVILIWVLADKPYRCPDGNHDGMTEGDRQMVLAQVLQLLSYAVAAICLVDEGEGVQLFAALVGLGIVLTQLVVLAKALRSGGDSDGDSDARSIDSSTKGDSSPVDVRERDCMDNPLRVSTVDSSDTMAASEPTLDQQKPNPTRHDHV